MTYLSETEMDAMITEIEKYRILGTPESIADRLKAAGCRTGLIDKFAGTYAFLSNFQSCTVTWEGVSYGSVEAADLLEYPEIRHFLPFIGFCGSLAVHIVLIASVRNRCEGLACGYRSCPHPVGVLQLFSEQELGVCGSRAWRDKGGKVSGAVLWANAGKLAYDQSAVGAAGTPYPD